MQVEQFLRISGLKFDKNRKTGL